MTFFYSYLKDTYTQYHSFLDGSASLDIDNFLKSGEQELSFFAKVCNELLTLCIRIAFKKFSRI